MQFKRAIRAKVPLLIGLSGGTGSGKTFSALRLATGMSPGRPIAVIDTENGRAGMYADYFRFDVADLRAPFSPAAYTDAIKSADAAGYGVIIVDSMTHEYAGDGGVLDMQEAEFERMGGRDAAMLASWIKPKMAHKAMVTQLLQIRAHLILCFRAEPKVDVRRDERGKMKVVPTEKITAIDGWLPITEKNLPYELTISLMFRAEAPGVPRAGKLQEQHRPMIRLDAPLDERAGAALAAWAAGGKAAEPEAAEQTTITEKQALDINECLIELGEARWRPWLLERCGVSAVCGIPAEKYEAIRDFLHGELAKKRGVTAEA